MKKYFISIIVVLAMVLIFALYNIPILHDKSNTNKSITIQGEKIVQDGIESICFESYEDFYASVKEAKKSHSPTRNDEVTESGIETLTEFYDLKNTKEEMILEGIVVETSGVILTYRDKSIKDGTFELPKNEILFATYPSSEDDDYVNTWYTLYKKSSSAEKTIINGVPAIKNIVEQDGKTICHQYHWTQDGYNNFLVLYSGVIEKYKEETFFKLQKKKIPN